MTLRLLAGGLLMPSMRTNNEGIIMSEPVSATAVVTTGAGVATLGWFSGFDPAVVIGSCAGAVFFVTSAADLTVPKRLGFFIVSLVFGVLPCRPASEIIPNGGKTLLILNAIICGMVVLRLMLFKRNRPPLPIWSTRAATAIKPQAMAGNFGEEG